MENKSAVLGRSKLKNSSGIVRFFLLPLLLSLLPILVNFFHEKYIFIPLALTVLLFFFESGKKQRFKMNRSLLRPFVIMIAVYVLYTLISVDLATGAKVLERQISLLLIPLIVFCSDFTQERFKFFFRSFLITMAVISVFSFGYLFWFYQSNLDWVTLMNETSNTNTYLQYKFPHLIGTHPTYWSYLLIIANCILLSYGNLGLSIKRYWIIFLLVLFNGTIIYLSARTPLLINSSLHLLALFFYLRKVKTSLAIKTTIALVIIISALLLFNSPLLKAKFLALIYDERVYLWPTALETIKNNYFLLGEGLGQGNKVLKEFIIENGDPRKNYNSFDLHNQYLRHYMDMGLLGILALIYLVYYPLSKVKGQWNARKLPLIGFSMLFALAWITEASLYRLKGIMIFAVFSAIFLMVDQVLNKSNFK